MIYRIKVNEKKYKYMKVGKGSKNLILIPGVSITSVLASADLIEKRFSSYLDDYTLYLFERTTNVLDDEDAYSMAEDYVKVFDALGLDKVYIYGVSYGGIMSQIIGIKYPKKLVKCALISTTSRENDHSKAVGDRWSSIAKSRDFKLLNETFVKDLFSKMTIDKMGDKLNLIGNNIEEIDDNAVNNFAKYIKMCFYTTTDIRSFKAKAKVFCSYNDNVYPYQEGLYIADSLGCPIKLYKDYGHAVYDETDDVLNSVKEFFDE